MELEKDKSQVPEGTDRREFLKIASLFAARVAIGGTIAETILAPKEAEATENLDYNAVTRGPYNNIVNHYRRLFGRREDYQKGFEAALQHSGSIVEIPEGVYGILPKKINPRNPRAIEPGSEFLIERAAYLHLVYDWEEMATDMERQLDLADIELYKNRVEVLKHRYPDYDNKVLRKVGLPVVTLNNLDQKRREHFYRFPVPGTREYFEIQMDRWADYEDPSRLRHEAPFAALYDPAKSLYENLEVMYGPQLQAVKHMNQKAKYAVGAMISKMNSGANVITRPIFHQSPAGMMLKPNEIRNLNQWLGLTGTPYEIH